MKTFLLSFVLPFLAFATVQFLVEGQWFIAAALTTYALFLSLAIEKDTK